MENCIFCKIINKQIPSKVVYEDDNVLAFDDINPQAPVHVVVIPKKHVANVTELAMEDAGLVKAVIDACVKVAEMKGIKESGYRLINNCGKDAGQTVMHAHFHVLGGTTFTEHIV